MCQLNAVMEREGTQETLMEGVTGLEVTQQGIILRTYFEEPMTVAHASIKRIDFLGALWCWRQIFPMKPDAKELCWIESVARWVLPSRRRGAL